MTTNTAQGPPTGPTVTFIIGAARSGTTWLARALGADNRVAATYETHLFNAYLGPLMDVWDQHLQVVSEQSTRWNSTGVPPDSAVGLPYVLTTEQWQAALKNLVDEVFDSVARDRPSVQAIVEKTPSHSGHVDQIDLLTDGRARFVHIIRDGFDVVESTRNAGTGWAADWAPRDPATAARKWAAGVRGARAAAKFGDRYHELRYEDLVASPASRLLEVLRFIGVDAELDDAVKALERTDDGLFLGGQARELFSGPFPEPSGFRRSDGRTQAGRDRAVVIAAVGDLLEELGYGREPEQSGLRRRLWLASGAMETNLARLGRLVNRIRSDVEQRR